jgi:preprotein translocase subunit SecB
MNPSPLQLEHHWFTKVSIESHVNGIVGTENILECQFGTGQAEDNPRRFRAVLGLKFASHPEKQACYTGEICSEGFFQVLPEWPAEKMQMLVDANAPALLYGAIRELLLNITERGPWPPLRLIAMSFIDDAKKAEAAQKAQTTLIN